MSQLFVNFIEPTGSTRDGAHIQAASVQHAISIGESNQGYFDVVVPFDAAWPDTNYVATATVEFGPGNVSSINVGYLVKSTSGVTVRVFCAAGQWATLVVTVHIAAFRP